MLSLTKCSTPRLRHAGGAGAVGLGGACTRSQMRCAKTELPVLRGPKWSRACCKDALGRLGGGGRGGAHDVEKCQRVFVSGCRCSTWTLGRGDGLFRLLALPPRPTHVSLCVMCLHTLRFPPVTVSSLSRLLLSLYPLSVLCLSSISAPPRPSLLHRPHLPLSLCRAHMHARMHEHAAPRKTAEKAYTLTQSNTLIRSRSCSTREVLAFCRPATNAGTRACWATSSSIRNDRSVVASMLRPNFSTNTPPSFFCSPTHPQHIHAYMHTCIHAYKHTCIHAYMHTCIHAYMHTCIHAYIHAHTGPDAFALHSYIRGKHAFLTWTAARDNKLHTVCACTRLNAAYSCTKVLAP